jgi:hypothetical protein
MSINDSFGYDHCESDRNENYEEPEPVEAEESVNNYFVYFFLFIGLIVGAIGTFSLFIK